MLRDSFVAGDRSSSGVSLSSTLACCMIWFCISDVEPKLGCIGGNIGDVSANVGSSRLFGAAVSG